MGYIYSKDNQFYDYVIYKKGDLYCARKSLSGNVFLSNTNFKDLIMACHDDAPITGANCFIKTGIYYLDDTIAITKTFNLIGEGTNWTKGTIIELLSGSNCDMITIDGNGTHIYMPTIKDLTLQGRKGFQASGNGLRFIDDISDVVLTNLYVTNCKEANIVFLGGWYNNLTNVWTEGAGTHGLENTSQLRIVNSTFAYNLEYGLKNNGSPLLLSNCEFTNNGQHGLYQTLGDGGQIFASSCRFKNNSQDVANTYDDAHNDAGYMMFSSCLFNGASSSRYGVYAGGGANSRHVRMLNCRFSDHVTAPFFDAGCDSFTVDCVGTETANAEEPQSTHNVGAIIDFTDSGDGSGDGLYIKKLDGNWVKID